MLPILGKVVYNRHIANLQMDKLRFQVSITYITVGEGLVPSR